MRFGDMLHGLLLQGKQVMRASEPHIHYDLDAAEKDLVVWSMDAESDELVHHQFTTAQLVAQDWEEYPCSH